MWASTRPKSKRFSACARESPIGLPFGIPTRQPYWKVAAILKAYEELIRPTKITLQLLYARNHSLLMDLKILLHTGLKLINEDWIPKELKPHGRVKRYRMISAASI